MKNFFLFFFLLTAVFAFPPIIRPAETGGDVPTAKYVLSKSELHTSLKDIEKLLEKGEWLEAQKRYKTILRHDLDPIDQKSVQKNLEELNMRILFSPVLTSDSFYYQVQSGDSLYKIAKKNGTTIALIKRSNQLKKDLIKPGMQLKVSKAVYTVHVDKSENVLHLYQNGELLKTYRVATGTNNSTPIGKFTIETKLENPTWYKAGAVVPPDSPDNILGTRWMGFSLDSYGIHGTTLPETIGTQASEGCIRMLNRDVEELYDILPLKTEVTVVD